MTRGGIASKRGSVRTRLTRRAGQRGGPGREARAKMGCLWLFLCCNQFQACSRNIFNQRTRSSRTSLSRSPSAPHTRGVHNARSAKEALGSIAASRRCTSALQVRAACRYCADILRSKSSIGKPANVVDHAATAARSGATFFCSSTIYPHSRWHHGNARDPILFLRQRNC